jgi:hypothetical protein
MRSHVMTKVSAFKIGDSYIHFTKYGGINYGVVMDILKTSCYHHTPNGDIIMFESVVIINQIGNQIHINGIDGSVYKIL